VVKLAQKGTGKTQGDRLALFVSFGAFYHVYPVVLANKGTFALADSRGFALFGYIYRARKDIDEIMRFCHIATLAAVVGKTRQENV
jgi:hypothetical protein